MYLFKDEYCIRSNSTLKSILLILGNRITLPLKSPLSSSY
jgi:hypothetical protein